MSHELIYQYIWSDKTEGGALRLSLVISYLPQYFPRFFVANGVPHKK